MGRMMRRFWLPVLTSGATVAIILSSGLTATDLVLNALAISFIVEADDLLATTIHPKARSRAQPLVDGLRRDGLMRDGEPAQIPWLPGRLYALCCAIFVSNFVLNVEGWMWIFGNEKGGVGRQPCTDLSDLALWGMVGLLGGMLSAHALALVVADMCARAPPCRAMRLAARNLAFNVVAFLLPAGAVFLLLTGLSGW